MKSTQEIAEEIWDEFSEYVSDDVFSLSQIADSSVIHRVSTFVKAIESYDRQANKWVSVKDARPEKDIEVMWYCPDPKGVEIDKYTDNYPFEWFTARNSHRDGYTHWMPLPEPPTTPKTEIQ